MCCNKCRLTCAIKCFKCCSVTCPAPLLTAIKPGSQQRIPTNNTISTVHLTLIFHIKALPFLTSHHMLIPFSSCVRITHKFLISSLMDSESYTPIDLLESHRHEECSCHWCWPVRCGNKFFLFLSYLLVLSQSQITICLNLHCRYTNDWGVRN